MKKLKMVMATFIFVFGLTALSYAHYDEYSNKIKEGFKEIVKSPLVLADEVKNETTAAEFKPFGVFGGFLKGSFYALRDVTSGLFRILTFSVEDDNYFVNKFKNR